MKILKLLAAFLSLAVVTSIVSAWNTQVEQPEKASEQNTIVLLKFKAQPDKGAMAVTELKALLAKVKEEPNFVSIKLHIDPNDPTNILLYEEWEDAAYYNGEHMNTPHLQAFMANSRNFLTGPPEISFWEVKHQVE